MNINLQKATINDIELLIKLRFDSFIEDGINLDNEQKNLLTKQMHSYFQKHILTNTFIGILAYVDNKIASVAFLTVSEKPASPFFITGKTGTLLNVLTYPKYRRKGIAKLVIEKITQEALHDNVSIIYLNSTDDGKKLYEKLGFTTSKYTGMRKILL